MMIGLKLVQEKQKNEESFSVIRNCKHSCFLRNEISVRLLIWEHCKKEDFFFAHRCEGHKRLKFSFHLAQKPLELDDLKVDYYL